MEDQVPYGNDDQELSRIVRLGIVGMPQGWDKVKQGICQAAAQIIGDEAEIGELIEVLDRYRGKRQANP